MNQLLLLVEIGRYYIGYRVKKLNERRATGFLILGYHNLAKDTFVKARYLMVKRKQIFNRIKAVIAEQGQTSIWLSKELGVNPTTVSKWCRNEMQPTVESLFNIAKAQLM